MRSRTHRVATFVISGLAVTTLCVALLLRTLGCPHAQRRFLGAIVGLEYVPAPDVKFRFVLAGSGKGPLGSDYETFEYRSSDCVQIDSDFLTFASADQAKQEMERRLSQASRVLSPYLEINAGREVLDRAVLRQERDRRFVILRRNGPRIHLIYSASLHHAEEFERRIPIADGTP
jgi:hypothetical protein